jgi:hypothetical protein
MQAAGCSDDCLQDDADVWQQLCPACLLLCTCVPANSLSSCCRRHLCGTISMHHIHGCAWLLKSAALYPILVHGIGLLAQCVCSCIMLFCVVVFLSPGWLNCRLACHMDSHNTSGGRNYCLAEVTFLPLLVSSTFHLQRGAKAMWFCLPDTDCLVCTP